MRRCGGVVTRHCENKVDMGASGRTGLSAASRHHMNSRGRRRHAPRPRSGKTRNVSRVSGDTGHGCDAAAIFASEVQSTDGFSFRRAAVSPLRGWILCCVCGAFPWPRFAQPRLFMCRRSAAGSCVVCVAHFRGLASLNHGYSCDAAPRLDRVLCVWRVSVVLLRSTTAIHVMPLRGLVVCCVCGAFPWPRFAQPRLFMCRRSAAGFWADARLANGGVWGRIRGNPEPDPPCLHPIPNPILNPRTNMNRVRFVGATF